MIDHFREWQAYIQGRLADRAMDTRNHVETIWTDHTEEYLVCIQRWTHPTYPTMLVRRVQAYDGVETIAWANAPHGLESVPGWKDTQGWASLDLANLRTMGSEIP